jgi:hypothetical protein
LRRSTPLWWKVASTRAVASQFGVSRSALVRHQHHLERPARSEARTGQFEAASVLLERAKTERERLRAQEGIRRALELELRDFSRSRAALKAPDEEQLRRLERNLEDAWESYQRVAGGSLDVALRALSGVREAIKALRMATAKVSQDPILISLADAIGEVATMWEIDRDEALASYGVPKEYRTDEFHIKVQLSFGGGPDVRVYDRAGKLVWRKPSTPGPRQPRCALPHEEPLGDGNGHH